MGRLADLEDRPCIRCGSANHSSKSHSPMEKLYRSLEIGWVGSPGPGGERSPSDLALATPDRLAIVPCSIGVVGSNGFPLVHVPAISCVLKEAEGDGHTFMLWCTLDKESHERVCGVVGSSGMVDVRFYGTTPNWEHRTT